MTSDGFFARAVAGAEEPSMSGGASGYFSAPSDVLDPDLFDESDVLHGAVRSAIILPMLDYLNASGLKGAGSWLHLWITGSALSYQWTADRGNGDLDIMVGVEWQKFQHSNEGWLGVSQEEFARELTASMKDHLWPQTAQTLLGNRVYEVTYYLNARTQADVVTALHPYAAYDVIRNAWVVRPPKLPPDPKTLYDSKWFDAASEDSKAASDLVSQFGQHRAELASQAPGTASWHDAGSKLHVVVAKASALWEDLHGGRQEAFSPQGHGYGDYRNFRWQMGKASGAVAALHAIGSVGEEAKDAEETAQWGGPIAGADEALSRAAQFHQNVQGRLQ